MAHPFLENLTVLADLHLSTRFRIDCRHFFSGAALYSGGVICVSLSPVGLAFKLSESRCSNLIGSGTACPLRYFAKSPVKKGYVLFPDFEQLKFDDVTAYFAEAILNANS